MDTINRAERAYYEVRKVCNKIVNNPALSEAERRAAARRKQNAYAAYAAAVLNDYFSRTNLLVDLIEQLEALAGELTGGNNADAIDTVSAAIEVLKTALEEDKTENAT